MYTVKGKKLLVLGSTADIAGIVKKAKEMGAIVIVTDNKSFENAPGKQIADKYYDVSFSEIDKVVDLIKEENIEGILTGYTDSYLPFYYEICEKAGLPCYGNQEQFEISTNKVKFKTMCKQYGVNDIPGGFAYSLEEAAKIGEKIGYPLMLKPADNSGSRGVILCETKDELKESYDYACSFSKINCVICEKYLTCDNIGASYQIVNGDIRLSSVSDRHIYKALSGGSSMTKDLMYPSKYTERYINEVNQPFIKMLEQKYFQNGMLSIQAFVDESNFYFCEMCFRPSGGHHYTIVQDVTGADGMELMIEYALNGKNETIPYVSPNFNNYYGMVSVIGKPGKTIHSVEGIEQLRNKDYVLELTQSLAPGDTIGKDGTTAQVLFHIWYKADNYKLLKQRADEILVTTKFIDNTGDNLVLGIQYYQ